MRTILFWILAISILASCSKPDNPSAISAEDYHKSVDKVGEIMVHDIFSPPVASRVFAYPNVAAYEIIAKGNQRYRSLSGQLTGFVGIPAPAEKEEINFQLAALIAHIDLNRRLIFSEDRMIA